MRAPRLFLSHAWGADERGRSCHARAVAFARHLEARGLRVWIDENDLRLGHIDAAMARGIEECEVFVVLLTRTYCQKVQRALSDPQSRDSCAKEWSCAMVRGRHIVPVIFEPGMRDVHAWPMSAVTMQLGGYMHVDAAADDLASGADQLVRLLGRAASAPAVATAATAATPSVDECLTPRAPPSLFCHRWRSR